MARGIERRLRQLAAQPEAAEGLAHVQALHLRRVGIVRVVQRPQRAAAGQGAVDARDQQRAARLGVLARQPGEFLLEILEAQVDAEPVGVLAKERAHFVEFARGGAGEFDQGRGGGVQCSRSEPVDGKF